MIKRINRNKCLETYRKFPQADNFKEEFFFPRVYKNYFLTLFPQPEKIYIKSLSTAITNLVKHLNYDSLIFLGDTKTPLLYLHQDQNNKKAAKAAIDYLIRNKIGKKFNGALKVDITGLPGFLEHLYFLTSANATLPTVHFMDKDETIVANICQYGVLHLSTLNKKIDNAFRAFNKTQIQFQFHGKCISPILPAVKL
jgi:hypothetical protein